LNAKDFRLSRSKIEYIKYNFSATTQEEGDVKLNSQMVSNKDTFHYLGAMLQKNGDINENASHIIKADWLK
jgi:hypothetical protein